MNDTQRGNGTTGRPTTRLPLDPPPGHQEDHPRQKKNGPCQGRSAELKTVCVRLSLALLGCQPRSQRVGRARLHTSGAHNTRRAR